MNSTNRRITILCFDLNETWKLPPRTPSFTAVQSLYGDESAPAAGAWSLEQAKVALLWAFCRSTKGSQLTRGAEEKMLLLKIFAEALEKLGVREEFQ